MAQQPIFIYGFIQSDRPEVLGSIGIEQRDVRVVPGGEIAAVVSDSPFEDFESLEKETLLRSLAVYQAVIEKIMPRFKIIPMKYGSVVESEETLKRLMGQHHDRVAGVLSQMAGSIEVEVVAFWKDFDAVLKAQGQQQEIQRIKASAESGDGGSLQEVQIKVGKMVKAALEKKREEIADHMISALTPKVRQHALHTLIDDTMILNAAFLLDQASEKDFEAAVEGLDRYFEDTINFRIVGPLPPYSFSTLMLKRLDMQEVEKARKQLGLGVTATREEIRDAFWRLSKEAHPDKFPGDKAAAKRYEEIAKAYKLLDDYCKDNGCSFESTDADVRIELALVSQSGGQ